MDFSAYGAITIDAAATRAPAPFEHRVQGIPWIAHAKAYCQSTSLQMIAAWRSGRARPLGFFNWLMGFTYGAGHLRGTFIYLPYDDPEAGFRFAAPFLGLAHRYFVADEPDLYVAAMKASLSAGWPIRIMLDSATLKGRRDYFSPHSVVVAGYRGAAALVYDTRVEGERDRAVTGDGDGGDDGIEIAWSVILDAARRVSETYRYPWRFQFTRFEEAEPAPPDEGRVRARNARGLIGADVGFAATGAAAPRSLARELRATGAASDGGGDRRRWDDLQTFLEYGVYTRADNAAYLDEIGAGQAPLRAAARCLASSSERYAAMVEALRAAGTEDPAPLTRLLLATELEAIAQLEEEAGRLLAGG